MITYSSHPARGGEQIYSSMINVKIRKKYLTKVNMRSNCMN